MIETWKRLWEATPRYWRRVRNWAIGATASITAALQYSDSMPSEMVTVLGHLLSAAIAITLVSQLTSSRR